MTLRCMPELHIPHKKWFVERDMDKRGVNLKVIERWARKAKEAVAVEARLNIRYKDDKTLVPDHETVNYLAIERWADSLVTELRVEKNKLYIPYKKWAHEIVGRGTLPAIQEEVNLLTIERWAANVGCYEEDGGA